MASQGHMRAMYVPAIKIKAGPGELVVDAEFYNKVAGARLWYTPTQGEDAKTTVRVQQVLTQRMHTHTV